MIGIYQSNYVFAANNCPQFANEINLASFDNKNVCYRVRVTETHNCYLYEANKRNLNCSSQSSSGWSCKSGYRKSGNSCIKSITIPANAYAAGDTWYCKSGYSKSGNRCVKKPENVYEGLKQKVGDFKNYLQDELL